MQNNLLRSERRGITKAILWNPRWEKKFEAHRSMERLTLTSPCGQEGQGSLDESPFRSPWPIPLAIANSSSDGPRSSRCPAMGPKASHEFTHEFFHVLPFPEQASSMLHPRFPKNRKSLGHRWASLGINTPFVNPPLPQCAPKSMQSAQPGWKSWELVAPRSTNQLSTSLLHGQRFIDHVLGANREGIEIRDHLSDTNAGGLCGFLNFCIESDIIYKCRFLFTAWDFFQSKYHKYLYDGFPMIRQPTKSHVGKTIAAELASQRPLHKQWGVLWDSSVRCFVGPLMVGCEADHLDCISKFQSVYAYAAFS